MLAIPAIDIQGGKCVRLFKGDPAQSTIYFENPLEAARHWAEQGVKRIHVVDLDGAISGAITHLEIAARVQSEFAMEVEFGGGLRSVEKVEKALSLGIRKLIIGTAAVRREPWVLDLVKKYRDHLIVGIDAKNGEVALEGWQKSSRIRLEESLKQMESDGFLEVIYTDISKDGTLTGPNVESTREVCLKTKMGVYASGGVSRIQDIVDLSKIPDLRGVIVGKALYDGRISVAELKELQCL